MNKRTSKLLAPLAPLALLALPISLAACSAEENGVPIPAITDVRWVVPSPGLPADVLPQASNNNAAIAAFEGKIYMAFRSAPTHFASSLTTMTLVSTSDGGRTFAHEATISRGADLREPYFFVMNDTLFFYLVELGTNPAAFEPKEVLRMTKKSGQPFTSVEPAGLPDGMMVWAIKTHDGQAFMTAYQGNHYSTEGDSAIDVRFLRSKDGLTWSDVDPENPVVYHGGVSEVGFDFDTAGNLWAVTRNEDGDASGFGSQVVFAPKDALGKWQFPEQSSPYRYDSPRMFRQGEDLYLIARRNIVYTGKDDPPFVDMPYDVPGAADLALGPAARRDARIAAYSALPKRTSLYKIDRAARSVVWQKDLPSAADTAFASIVEQSPGVFLVANYSNPVKDGPFDWADDSPEIPKSCGDTERWTWIQGQTSLDCGTQIYFATLDFR